MRVLETFQRCGSPSPWILPPAVREHQLIAVNHADDVYNPRHRLMRESGCSNSPPDSASAATIRRRAVARWSRSPTIAPNCQPALVFLRGGDQYRQNLP
jgi:hypothetical protein